MQIDWPFLAAEALESRLLTFRELRRFHEAVYPGVWVPRGVDLSAEQRARAAWLWSRRQGVLAGLSASKLLGARYIDGAEPAELVHHNRRPPRLLTVHTDPLLDGEVTTVAGLPTTTAARTGFDLGRRRPLVDGVQRIDALMNATHVKVDDIRAVADGHPGARGVRQLRETLRLVDGGSQSPYESLARVMLIQKGFPRPETQVHVYEEDGWLFADLDLGWKEFKVGVDFDGAGHWLNSRQWNKDVERYARLPELGWIDIRVTSGILHNNPWKFFRRVGDALVSRGCPQTW